ncbi:MAG: YdcF family protein [Eubacterium sp.]|nr:YdcF family protein [Eubacterium sp.]
MHKIWYGRCKWLKRIVVVGFLLGILGLAIILGINQYIKVTAGKQIGVKTPKVDCILVLGAGLTEEGEPSLVLRDRLDRAIELYQQGVSTRLLMSGDHGQEGYDEVRAMKQYAVNAGINPNDIFMDHAGFSTYESIYRARDVFQVKRLAIVTQPYHEYRAVYIAMKLGLEVYGTPSKPTQYKGSWILEAREKLARTKEFFNLIIQPKPTYLGDAIPISGSGSQTDDTKVTEKVGEISVEKQLQQIVQSEKLWRLEYREKEDPNFYQGASCYWYAVTDLDQNGRLEIISAVTNGNGHHFTNECYEISQSGTSLEKIPGLSELAPIEETQAFFDKTKNCYHYAIADMDRGGAAYHELRYEDVVKEKEKIHCDVYASVSDENEKKTCYYKGDFEKKISNEECGKILEQYYDGMEEKKVKFAWFQCNDRKKDTTLSKLKKSYDEWSVK